MCYEQEASLGFTVTNASHLAPLLLAWVRPHHHRLAHTAWSWTQKNPLCLSLWGGVGEQERGTEGDWQGGAK